MRRRAATLAVRGSTGDGRWLSRALGAIEPLDARRQDLTALGKRIFELTPGSISEPLKLEHYEKGSARFRTDGYVLVRTEHVEPASFTPFESVTDRVRRYAVREQLDALTAVVKTEVLAAAEVEIDSAALDACLPALAAGDASISPRR